MDPPLRPNLPPPFTDLGEYPFEDLCRELLGNQSGIRTCDVFGVRGQGQRMIDLIATREDGRKEVAQCKCYRELDETDLKKAADGFLHRIGEWKDWGIVRFTMMVSSSIRNTKVQDEIENQRRAYKAQGLDFETLGDETITQRLRPFPTIVEIHLGAHMVHRICPGQSYEGMSEFFRRSEELPHKERGWILTAASSYGDDFDVKVTQIRNLARRGRPREALEQLEAWMHPDRMILVGPLVRAKALRTAAGLALDALNNVEQAEQFLGEAKQLAPKPDDQYEVLEAALIFRKNGVEKALERLSEPRSVHGMNLRLGLLLQSEGGLPIVRALENPPFPPDADTYRIGSIAAHICGDWPESQRMAAEALRLGPELFQVRYHAAKMDFLAAILSSAPDYRHLHWPQSVPRECVRRDDASLLRLKNAESVFADLLNIMEVQDDERPFVECWRLASAAQ